MKVNNEIRIKLSTEEKEKIKRNADKIGLTINEYGKQVLLNTEVSITIKSRE